MLLQRRASVTCTAIAQHVRKLLGFSGRAKSREAFGVRGACSRFRARWVIESAGKPERTPNASRRSVAALPRYVICISLLALCSVAAAQSREERVRQALEKLPHPSSAAEFQTAAHLTCLNQGMTSICWSFAACSFVESEMARLKLPPARLSVTYPVYCAFLEKARRYVRTRGESRVNPGDL